MKTNFEHVRFERVPAKEAYACIRSRIGRDEHFATVWKTHFEKDKQWRLAIASEANEPVAEEVIEIGTFMQSLTEETKTHA